MRVLLVLTVILINLTGCNPEECTKTISTFNGTEEIPVPCEFAD